jgi:hypothetical protein
MTVTIEFCLLFYLIHVTFHRLSFTSFLMIELCRGNLFEQELGPEMQEEHQKYIWCQGRRVVAQDSATSGHE